MQNYDFKGNFTRKIVTHLRKIRTKSLFLQHIIAEYGKYRKIRNQALE